MPEDTYIYFKCANCGAELQAESSQAGEEARCIECSYILIAPPLRLEKNKILQKEASPIKIKPRIKTNPSKHKQKSFFSDSLVSHEAAATKDQQGTKQSTLPLHKPDSAETRKKGGLSFTDQARINTTSSPIIPAHETKSSKLASSRSKDSGKRKNSKLGSVSSMIPHSAENHMMNESRNLIRILLIIAGIAIVMAVAYIIANP